MFQWVLYVILAHVKIMVHKDIEGFIGLSTSSLDNLNVFNAATIWAAVLIFTNILKRIHLWSQLAPLYCIQILYCKLESQLGKSSWKVKLESQVGKSSRKIKLEIKLDNQVGKSS